MELTTRPTPFSKELDEFIHQLLRTWHVPGLTVAVIDGPSTFSKGYGYAVLPNTLATPETVFFAASTTKSFTAGCVSLLEDDSKTSPLSSHHPPGISLKATLSSVVPDDFVLINKQRTSEVTFEDALSNRTGIPDHKRSFHPSTESVKDVVRSLRYLPLAADIRAQYLYSSYMFSAVSHAIETITRKSLGDFMRERIWNPLEMRHTYWTPQEAREAGSTGTVLARGYAWNSSSEQFVEEPVPDFPAVSGAGAIISNVVDYTKWLRCMMTKSTPLSPAAHQTLTEPRIHFTEHATNPFPPPHAYALGWTINTYRGQRVIWHGGGWTGYGSVMMYLPALQWGLVMMGNTAVTSNCVQVAVYMHLLDELLGTPTNERTDWSQKLQERILSKREDNKQAKSRLYPSIPSPVSPPTASLESHIGQYRHPGYGEMNIELEGSVLLARRLLQEIPMIVRLIHIHGDHWMATLEVVNQDPRDYESVKATFSVADSGSVDRLGVDFEPALKGEMIWFERVTS
ncbi:penicillin-binding [Trichoderma arundinaceum]|uniref:Penicillin-binding n=1 Tax=Trichoderma arundinaceum TaxID=490622 RepID=A0A395NLU8_TRIAR|nr:penicillin-binding [Trichoderma arundinaceum]